MRHYLLAGADRLCLCSQNCDSSPMRMMETYVCRVVQRCRNSEVQSQTVSGCAHEYFRWVLVGDLPELHEADRHFEVAGDLYGDDVAHLSSVDDVRVQKSRNLSLLRCGSEDQHQEQCELVERERYPRLQ